MWEKGVKDDPKDLPSTEMVKPEVGESLVSGIRGSVFDALRHLLDIQVTNQQVTGHLILEFSVAVH